MKTVSIAILIFILVMVTCTVKAQNTEKMETFLDLEIQGIKITVNATAETQPNRNITINLYIKPLEEKVDMEHFNFSVFGYINGTHKTQLPIYPNITSELTLPYECNFTCYVLENVWGITYGEITLKYKVTYTYPGGEITQRHNFATGFDMTRVENVYLKTVEEQLKNLNSILAQLNQTFREYFGIDLTPENFNKKFQEFRGTQSELSNTRMTVAVLVMTTIFFIATTAYLFLRKPKTQW